MPTHIPKQILRLSVGTVRLAAGATGKLLRVAGRLIPFGAEPPEPSAAASAPPETSVAPDTTAPPATAPTATAAPPDPAPPPTPYDTEPLTPLTEADAARKTIDDTDEVVAEFAEPGAEDGAGAQLEVDEPWPGFAGMTADHVIARLSSATTAELALVELYERLHKRRATVLGAAERRLRSERSSPAADA